MNFYAHTQKGFFFLDSDFGFVKIYCTYLYKYRYKYKYTTFAAVGGTLGDQRCRMMGHGARLNFIHHES